MARRYVLGPNAAREVEKLIRGNGEVSRRRSLATSIAVEKEFDFPFSVRWAQSVGESGSWIIWIPSSRCLVVDGNEVDVASGLDAAGGDYPSGWYVIQGVAANATRLFLNVVIEDSDDSEGDDVEAVFSETEGESQDGSTSVPVQICSMSGKDVVQIVSSAIVLTSGGGESGDCVKSLNERIGDVDVIGGVGIEVETVGQTIKISLNSEKDYEDEDPNGVDDPCTPHPGEGVNGGVSDGENDGDGEHSGGVKAEGDEASGGGCRNCEGSSSVGGASATGGASGGSSGTQSQGVSTPNGIQATKAPTAGPAASGTGSAVTSGSSSSYGKPAAGGLFNGSTISAKRIESTTAHGQLTQTKKMNQSPFKSRR